jgi:sugar lactone lactonase YvrE
VTVVLDARLAVDAGAELGEGPVWDARTRDVYFVDIMRGTVHAFSPGTERLATYHVGQPVGAVGLAARGLVLAVRDGFARLDPESGAVRLIAEVDRDRMDLRMNDGACDPAGRFWAGTMALDERQGAGALYRLDPDGSVHLALQPVTISNGLDWSADGTRMYFIDSPTGRVDVFDFDAATGRLANRRPFLRIAPEAGLPDGLTVDADDHVWVALWGGGAVNRYAPDGSLAAVVRLPVTHPTSCCFGGGDLRDLYITTAWIALDSAARTVQPHAGGVFVCRPGVAGRPANRFAG